MYSAIKGLHDRPQDDIDPSEKLLAPWHLKAARHIYSYYKANLTAWGEGSQAEDRESRLYANGDQGTDRYQKVFNGVSSPNKHPGTNSMIKARKNYMNIDYTQLVSMGPKLMNVILGRMMREDQTLRAVAVDPLSTAKKQDQRILMEFELDNKKFIEGFSERSGVQLPKRDYVPKDKLQLDVYAKMGGFKLNVESAAKKIIKLVMNECSWDNQIRKRVFLDLVQVGKAATRDYLDPVTKRIKTEYIDALDLIMEASAKGDFSDSTFAAHVSMNSLLELRKMLGLNDKEIRGLAGSVAKYYISDWANKSTYYTTLKDGAYPCDSWKVPVLNYEILSVDSNFYVKRKVKDEMIVSPTRIYKEPYETGKSKIKNSENGNSKEYIEDTELRMYKGCWLINTDKVFDYGLQYDVPYQEDRPRVSYRVIKMDVKAINKTLKPFHDQTAITFFRMQGAISRLRGEGVTVDYSALTGMTLGGHTADPMDLLTISDQRGYLILRSSTAEGPLVLRQQNNPLTRIPGNSGLLNDLVAFVDFVNRMISTFAGIDSFSATSQSGSQPLTAAETNAASQSTSDVLNNVFTDYLHLKVRQAESIVYRAQVLASYHKDVFEKYLLAVGIYPAKTLGIMEEMSMASFGIFVEPVSGMRQKEMLLKRASEAMSNGSKALTTSDFFMITDMVEQDEIKEAAAYLTLREEEAQERSKEASVSTMYAQSDAQVKADAVMNGAKIDLEKELSKMKIEEIFAQAIANIIEKKAEGDMGFDKAMEELNVLKAKHMATVNPTQALLNQGPALQVA